MLAHISSRELTEWAAYEQYSGPLGQNYANEVLAGIHELTQTTNKLLGAKMKSNPVPDPRPYPRPHEIAKAARESEED